MTLPLLLRHRVTVVSLQLDDYTMVERVWAPVHPQRMQLKETKITRVRHETTDDS
jgi:hypothetical protein